MTVVLDELQQLQPKTDAERRLHKPLLVSASPAPCGRAEKRQHQRESNQRHEVDVPFHEIGIANPSPR
jgi:hypothetical protein